MVGLRNNFKKSTHEEKQSKHRDKKESAQAMYTYIQTDRRTDGQGNL